MVKGWLVGSNDVFQKSRSAKPFWIAALLTSAILLLLPSLVKLDGKAHADWLQFLGRFHPVAVHLPIGMILLVAVFEVAGRFRPALREAAAFVLFLSVLSCLSAMALGYMLAYGSGTTGAGVTRHMWGGILLTIGVLFAALLRPAWVSGRLPYVYPALLTGLLILLAWAAHQGGSLTHGSNYLTEYMPARLKQWPGLWEVEAKAPRYPRSFYARHIFPVFDANCVTCHGDAKVKGGLRLDSYDLMMQGGKDGPVIVPGKPENSILFNRITLPSDHKLFMPSDGKAPLKPQEIAWIKAWILQGASPTAPSLKGLVVPEEYKETELPQVGDYSPMMAQIAEVERSQGVKLVPVSRKLGDGLILNTVDVAAKFGDAQLAQFERFAPYIVEAELGRTAVTDACFNTLEKFTHLRALHLEDTAITGQGLVKLGGLSQLTYLNLSGTRVTEAAIAPVTSMHNLHHLYLYNTPAQSAATASAVQSSARSSP